MTARGVLLTGSALVGGSLLISGAFEDGAADTVTAVCFFAGAVVGMIGILAGGADRQGGGKP